MLLVGWWWRNEREMGQLFLQQLFVDRPVVNVTSLQSAWNLQPHIASRVLITMQECRPQLSDMRTLLDISMIPRQRGQSEPSNYFRQGG
ncbi:hypothetical protein V9T40_014735 [Parthenolecanium corni]|uniref:Uncharacterized protein n=1 Tax=Parthenolecanium corni TaxID=536013 RepID=A0AAN9XXY5_9HEMI